MRNAGFLIIPLVATLSLASRAQARPASEPATASTSVTLRDGTPVKLRVGKTVSSGEARTGDPVELVVYEDVRAGNRIIIPAGATATGTVLMPESRKVKGQVDINISEVNLADGEKIALRAKEAAVDATRTLGFFPQAPPYPHMIGKDLVIPKDTEVTAFVSGELALDAAKFPLAPNSPAATVAKTDAVPLTLLAVSSTPTGAEIDLDGIFAGETPATLSVSAGDHIISLRMAGYDSIRHTIHVAGAKLKLTAQLTSGGANGVTMSCWEGVDCVNAAVGIAPGVTTKPVAQQKKKPDTNWPQ